MIPFINSLSAIEEKGHTLYQTKPKVTTTPPTPLPHTPSHTHERHKNKNNQASLRRKQKLIRPSHLPTARALSQLPVAHVVRSWVCVSIPPPKVSSLVISVLTGKVRKGKQQKLFPS